MISSCVEAWILIFDAINGTGHGAIRHFLCLFFLLTENDLGAPQRIRRIRAEWYQDELASLDLLLRNVGAWDAPSETYGFEL